MCTLRDVIDCSQTVRLIAPEDSVLEAVHAMCRWRVRTAVVGSLADPMGILCERDVLERVLSPQLDPATTKVVSVMSAPLVCLPAWASLEEALACMDERGLHQMPVTSNATLIGVVSATDLRRWTLAERERELSAFTSYLTGG